VTSSDDSILGGPHEGDERESRDSDGTNCGTRPRIDDTDGAVMTFENVFNAMSLGIKKNALTCECEGISRRRERNGVHPTPSRAREFTTDGTEWKLFTPEGGRGPEGRSNKFTISSGTRERYSLLVHVLDVCRENTSLHVRTAGSQQDIVRVPIDGKNSGPDRFLEELRDPPVTLFVKGTDRDSSGENRSTSARIAPTNNVVNRT